MPTYERLARFRRDFASLTPAQQAAIIAAVSQFVEDLQAGQGFRRGLRVKGVKGAGGIFEVTWAPDGRSTLHYGEPVRESEPHIIWRRVGDPAALANYRPPTWPAAEVPKQIHLDLATSEREAAESEALRLGARKAEDQPAPDPWRGLFDVAGHPFLLHHVDS